MPCLNDVAGAPTWRASRPAASTCPASSARASSPACANCSSLGCSTATRTQVGYATFSSRVSSMNIQAECVGPRRLLPVWAVPRRPAPRCLRLFKGCLARQWQSSPLVFCCQRLHPRPLALAHSFPSPFCRCAGNIFALPDGRIAYVDFGNVAELSQRNKEVGAKGLRRGGRQHKPGAPCMGHVLRGRPWASVHASGRRALLSGGLASTRGAHVPACMHPGVPIGCGSCGGPGRRF